MDIAVVGAGAWVKLSDDGQTVEQARIGLCAVAPTPKLADEASGWLAGRPATEDIFARAGELARNVAEPITDMRGTAEYRMHLIGVLVKRTLLRAAARARST
jgi:CO/xanthine dehydrogenase FAD-binding subunit